jgi:MATE family multidrug resistance protein
LREVFTLAAPLVLTQMLMTAMGVVDSVIVGRLGAAQLGAVGLGGIWVWTLTCFFVGSSAGVQTFVAQAHGSGRATECGRWSWQSLASIVPCAGLAAVGLLCFADDVIALLDPSDAIAPYATGYMRARALGIVGITGAASLSAFFRGIGDTRTPLFATAVANAANLVLDLGLVYGWFGMPRLGVVGAGLATAISEWIYLAVMLAFFVRPEIAARFDTRLRAPRLRDVKRLLRVGTPIGGQWTIEMLAFAIFTAFVARMGDAPMAASHAFIQLLSLSFMQAVGISIATTTLVGRYIGSGEIGLVARSLRSSMWLGGALAAVIATLFMTIPSQLLGLFTSDPAVLRYGGPLLLVGAFYQLFDAVAIVADGALRGAGDTRWPFVVRTLMSWAVFLPLAWTLAVHLDMGLTGAWLGGLGSVVLLACSLAWRFRAGAWQRIEI